MRKTFVDNPHYVEYICLLLQLHGLIAAGQGDDDEADAVRDKMDGPWRQLTPDEISRVRGLSADLYTIGGDRRSPDNLPDEAVAEIREAYSRADWPRVLELMREHEQELPPDEVAAYRGFCWGNMGQFVAAVEFLREAVRLNGGNSRHEEAFVTALLSMTGSGGSAEYVNEILEYAKAFSAADDNPRKLFLATRLYLASAKRSPSKEATSWYHQAIDVGKRAIAVAIAQGNADSLRKQIVEMHVNLAICYWQLGEMDAALAECEGALAVSPESEEALLLRGWLRRDDDRQAADDDFFQGLNRSIDLHSAMRDYPTQTLVFD